MKRVVVLGGGLSGLSAAYKLAEAGYSVDVLERDGIVGGISSSFKHDGFTLDYGPHKIYTQLDGVMDEIKSLVGEDLLTVPKKSKIYMFGKYFEYPVKITQLLFSMNPLLAFKCGLSYMGTAAKRKMFKANDDSYESYLVNRFGRDVYNLVFGPYAEKVWGNPSGLAPELAKTRVSLPSLFEMLKRVILGDRGAKEISAKEFYYPKHGILELSDKIVERIEKCGGKVHLNAEPLELRVEDGKVNEVLFTQEGKKKSLPADFVVSAIPINHVPALLRPEPGQDVKQAAESLNYRSIILLYLVVNKDRVFEDNWIFFPEKEYVFNRLSEQKGFSRFTVPEGKTALCVEITCGRNDAKFRLSDAELFELAINDLEKVGILNRGEVTTFFSKRIIDAYPMYTLAFRQALDGVLQCTDGISNLYTIGRQGLFNYNNMDHCMDMGFTAAKHIISGGTKEGWKEASRKFDDYKIVD